MNISKEPFFFDREKTILRLMQRRSLRPHPKLPDPCWEFTGARDDRGAGGGYGKISVGNRIVKVHRLAACIWLGIDMDDPRFVMHECDNPPCFNPKHLELGNNSKNIKDAHDRGLIQKLDNFGEKNANAKLDNEKVEQIKAMMDAGMTNVAIAKYYEVDQSTIAAIRNRESWT